MTTIKWLMYSADSSALFCFFFLGDTWASQMRAERKEKQKQRRYFTRQAYIFGCEYFLLMPALPSEGGNTLNISVTPAVGLSPLCFVHFVEKQLEKVHISRNQLSAGGPWQDNGEYYY